MNFSQFLESKIELKDRMKKFLFDKYKPLIEKETIASSSEIAIHHFADQYHTGQSSDLYKVLSSSTYKQAMPFEKENDIAKMMYNDLVEKFA